MSRQCERPDCAEPATVAYRFDARERIVFFDHLREGDPLAAGALCQRHAQVMVLPRGWWLDDRLGTSPALVVALATLGFVGVSLRTVYHYLAKAKKEEEGKPWTRRPR